MPSPVGPNAPNRAFGTTPPAEQQPEPTPEPQQPEAWAPTVLTPPVPDGAVPFATDNPPALAGGSTTTDTDRQSPTEDIAAATADPTGEHDGSGITGSHSRNV